MTEENAPLWADFAKARVTRHPATIDSNSTKRHVFGKLSARSFPTAPFLGALAPLLAVKYLSFENSVPGVLYLGSPTVAVVAVFVFWVAFSSAGFDTRLFWLFLVPPVLCVFRTRPALVIVVCRYTEISSLGDEAISRRVVPRVEILAGAWSIRRASLSCTATLITCETVVHETIFIKLFFSSSLARPSPRPPARPRACLPACLPASSPLTGRPDCGFQKVRGCDFSITECVAGTATDADDGAGLPFLGGDDDEDGDAEDADAADADTDSAGRSAAVGGTAAVIVAAAAVSMAFMNA